MLSIWNSDDITKTDISKITKHLTISQYVHNLISKNKGIKNKKHTEFKYYGKHNDMQFELN